MLKSLLLIIATVFINTTGQFMVKTGVNRVGAVNLKRFSRDRESPFVLARALRISSFTSSAR